MGAGRPSPSSWMTLLLQIEQIWDLDLDQTLSQKIKQESKGQCFKNGSGAGCRILQRNCGVCSSIWSLLGERYWYSMFSLLRFSLSIILALIGGLLFFASRTVLSESWSECWRNVLHPIHPVPPWITHGCRQGPLTAVAGSPGNGDTINSINTLLNQLNTAEKW